MIQLPPALEQRLKKLIPHAKDRAQFVKDICEREIAALETQSGEQLPLSIGEPAHRSQCVGGTLHLYTDGGSRGNPGESAIGCVLIDPATGRIMEEYKERIGIQTNNAAEYKALIRGLQLASRHHPNELICYMDSELIVRQMSGAYRVKMATLQPLFEEAQALAHQIGNVSFSHIPRSKNAHADRLVNQALDG